MNDQILLEIITPNPKVMVGKPVIRRTRLTVEYILNLLAHGATPEEILEEYGDSDRFEITINKSVARFTGFDSIFYAFPRAHARGFMLTSVSRAYIGF